MKHHITTLFITAAWITVLFLHSSNIQHPVNMTVTDLGYSENRITMKIKFFSDDLHGALNAICKTNINIEQKTIDPSAAKCLDGYIVSKFKLWMNNTPIALKFKKAYQKGDVTFAEYECAYKDIKSLKSVKIKNTIMFEGFPEQKNIVNLNFNESLKVLEFTNGEEEVQEITF